MTCRVLGLGLVCVLVGMTPPAERHAAFETRLAALRPSAPLGYFELAEEIADVANDVESRALARRLFSLAGALAPEELGRSACLALADMEVDERKRHRLLALAGLLGSGGMTPPAGAAPRKGLTGSSPSAVAGMVEAFSHYRRGKGSLALVALKVDGADELLDACDRFLPGGSRRFREDCKHYRGQLRPSLSDADLTLMLELEAALLAGTERTWSSELTFGGGDPLIEVDPHRIADTLGVDPSRPYYRDGRWHAQ